MINWIKKLSILFIASTMVAGCNLGVKEKEERTQVTLKVMYFSEEEFNRNYGMLFSALYPEIEFEVIPLQRIYNSDEVIDQAKAKQELIEKEKPDMVLVDLYELESLAEEGKLLSLDTYMARNTVQTDAMVPGMIDLMKEIGAGQLYGMPSSFGSQVLYYNKGMFDEYRVPYPTDQMTWNEVLQLAERFPMDGEPGERIYGIKLGYSGDLNEISDIISDSEGLNYVNKATKQMTIHTPAWQEAVELSKKLIESDAFYRPDEQGNNMHMTYQGYLKQNPFLANRVAMVIDRSYLLRELDEVSRLGTTDGEMIKDWDIVTVPVGTQNREETSTIFFTEIFAIMKDTPNADAAWKLISFIADEEHTRLKSKLGFSRGLPIHTKYIRDDAGHNLEAFYKLKSSYRGKVEGEIKLPNSFYEQFYGLKANELQEVQDGRKSVEEALEILQTKGDALLAMIDASGEGDASGAEGSTETDMPTDDLK